MAQPTDHRCHARAPTALQLGLSMVELMVALAIGVILLLGLVQIFGASRAAFAAAEGLSRVQESGRFVAEIMRNELRMAGHFGCINEAGTLGVPGAPFQPTQPYLFNHTVNPSTNLAGAPFAFRIDMPIEAFDFTAEATVPNSNYLLPANLTAAVAGGFTPALPNVNLGAIIGEAVVGSDVLVVRHLSADTIPLGPAGAAAGSVQIDPALSGFVQAGLMYALSSCSTMSLFQAITAPNAATGVFSAATGGRNATITADGSGWVGAENYGVGSIPGLHRYNMSVFYVALDVNGEPALFRRSVNPALAAPFIGPREAIAEGVENMQLVFGADTTPQMDDQADIYQTAGAINGNAVLGANPQARWRRVVNVRVGLLVRSPQTASDQSVAGRTARVADTVVTLPADGRVRQVYETVVVLRNRVKG